MKRHRWSKPDRNDDQYCLNGCGYVRCMLVPYSVRSTKPVAHYRHGGTDPRTGKSYRWHESRPNCVIGHLS